MGGPLTKIQPFLRRPLSVPAAMGVGLSVLLLNGCTQPPVPVVSTTRLYAIDQQGAANTCTASTVKLSEGKPATATLSVANDGGWCAITVSAPGDKPYAAGLLMTEPAHGTVYVHTVGDATRIDYTPDHGFSGADSFLVKLLPGSPTIQVAATVEPGPASVIAAPPPPPSPPAKTAPTPKRRGSS
jgi:hypothetical protein